MGIRVNIYSQAVVFVLLIYGLFFDFFEADDGEPCFIVSGIEGLVRPVFLTCLNTVEVGVDTFPIGSVPHCDGSALFRLEGTGDCVGVLVLNDFNRLDSAYFRVIIRVGMGHEIYSSQYGNKSYEKYNDAAVIPYIFCCSTKILFEIGPIIFHRYSPLLA